jgi:hypothetical protein
MVKFIVVNKPVTALRHYDIERDDHKNRDKGDCAQDDFFLLDLLLGR